MKKHSFFIAVIILLICALGMNNISNIIVQAQDSHMEHHAKEQLPIINQDDMRQLDSNDKISFKIKGIDYSTTIAQILFTINGPLLTNS